MKIRNPKSEIRRGTIVALLALGGMAMGDDSAVNQTAARQEQIRTEARLLVTRLDDVIAEYKRNGLARGDDFAGLEEVRAKLGSLSEQEMEQVIETLKQSGGDPTRMATAYAGQKEISVQLKKILAAHERDQDIAALAGAVRQLADRQAANLSTAIDARQLAAQDKSANGQTAVTASEQAQQSEQSAISEEVKLVIGKLDQLAADPKYQQAAVQLKQVPPEASSAADALGAGRLEDALTAEQSAHAQLEEAARTLTPAAKQEPPQNQDAGELAQVVKDQRDLLAKTTKAGAALAKAAAEDSPEAADKAMNDAMRAPNSALARRLAESGIRPDSPPDQIRNAAPMKAFLDARAANVKAQEQAAQAQVTALSAEEAALASKAQMVRDDLQKTAKEAGTPMANAITQMNSAQEALAGGDTEQASQEEADAAAQLEQAQQLAQQSAPSAPGAAGSTAPADPAVQLQRLQQGVNDLAAREKASVQQGDALKSAPMAAPAADLQANLAAKAAALSQTATDEAPAAVPALQGAANALQNAAQAMRAGGQADQAAAAQQAALQNLANAGAQLAAQAGAVAGQKQNLAEVQKAMAGLDAVIRQQQQLDAETATAEPPSAAKLRQLARLQGDVRKGAETVRQAVATGLPDAAKSLDKADTAMGEAAQNLTNEQIDAAEPRQKAALAALYQAQDALAERAHDLAQALGLPAAQAQAEAAAILSKAQTQTAAAQQAIPGNADLPPGPAGRAARQAETQLNQAARAAAQAGIHPEALPQSARDALRNAEQALEAAAAAARANQNGQAQGQAAQAGQALAAAQSALAGAQAGISAVSSPGNAQSGQQPGQPNSQPGRGAKAAREKGWADQPGGPTAPGAQPAHTEAAYLGLPDRDRAAIEQSQAEKYPQEYGAMIEEYMRSLASDSGGK